MNGKMSSISDAKKRLRRYARLIQRLGWSVSLSKIEVVTVSASFKVAGSLYSNEVVRYYGGRYELELFPVVMFTHDYVYFT